MSRPPRRSARGAPSDAAVPPKRGCFIIALRVVAGLLVLILLAGLLAFWQTRRVPGFYEEQQQRLAATDADELARLAQAFEQRSLAQATTIEPVPLNAEPDGDPAAGDAAATDPNAPRELTIGVLEANAWIQTRLDAWLANQQVHVHPELRKAVQNPVVGIEDGLIAFAARFTPPPEARTAGDEPSSQIISVYVSLAMTPDQRVQVQLRRVRIGRLPLPLEQVISRLGGMLGDQDREALALVQRAIDGIAMDPRMDLPGSQQLQILDIAVAEDQVKLLVKPIREALR